MFLTANVRHDTYAQLLNCTNPSVLPSSRPLSPSLSFYVVFNLFLTRPKHRKSLSFIFLFWNPTEMLAAYTGHKMTVQGSSVKLKSREKNLYNLMSGTTTGKCSLLRTAVMRAYLTRLAFVPLSLHTQHSVRTSSSFFFFSAGSVTFLPGRLPLFLDGSELNSCDFSFSPLIRDEF